MFLLTLAVPSVSKHPTLLSDGNSMPSGADLGAGRGGRNRPFCPGIFSFCKGKQRLLDVTSCFVTLDVFSIMNIINKKI